MDPGITAALFIVGIIILFGLSALGGNSNQGLGGGNKKGKFGVVGLVITIFGILGLSNYFQTVM